MRRLLLIAFMSLSLLAGCGYTLSSRLDGQPTRSVSFEFIENRTQPPRPGLEYELARRLKDEMATDRRLVFREGAADVRMRVSLTYFTDPTLVEDLATGDRAEILLRATARVDATGEALPGGRVSRPVSVSVSYAPGVGDSRRAGLDRLWRDLSREILDVAADYEWAPKN